MGPDSWCVVLSVEVLYLCGSSPCSWAIIMTIIANRPIYPAANYTVYRRKASRRKYHHRYGSIGLSIGVLTPYIAIFTQRVLYELDSTYAPYPPCVDGQLASGSMLWILLVCAVWVPFAAAQQTLLSSGETFTLANIPYHAPPGPVSRFGSEALEEINRQLGMRGTPKRFSAFSVMQTPESDFADSDLDSIVQAWKAKDDVWSEAFLHGMRRLSFSPY